MAFKDMFVKKKKRYGCNSNENDKIKISINKNPYSHSGKNLKFAIGKNITDQLNWEHFDKVNLLWDEEKKIGKIIKQKEGQHNLIGDNKLYFTYHWEKGLPYPEYLVSLCDLEILKNEITFSFPAC